MLRRRSRSGRALPALLAALLLLLVPVLASCGSGGTTTADLPRTVDRLAPTTPTTDLPTVAVEALPKEAVQTLRLIAAGGPFPYSRDGVTFQNREGILPEQRSGFYQEYTVETPGSSDRGARRIVTGEDGSRFYTDDHYSSFSEVVSG